MSELDFSQGIEKPEEVIVDDPRSKLRRAAFEAGIRAFGSPWWPELAPLRAMERELIKKAVREAQEQQNSARNAAPHIRSGT